MSRPPPRSTRPDPRLPYPTLFRSDTGGRGVHQFRKQLRAGEMSKAKPPPGLNVGNAFFHRGRSDEDLIGAGDPAAVLREKRDALIAQIIELCRGAALVQRSVGTRSEEHTSELQSLMRISYAVV